MKGSGMKLLYFHSIVTDDRANPILMVKSGARISLQYHRDTCHIQSTMYSTFTCDCLYHYNEYATSRLSTNSSGSLIQGRR